MSDPYLDALEQLDTMRDRAFKAEAAIKRVRDVCDRRDADVADMDPFYRQVVLVSVDDVRRALDGGAE